MRNTLFLLSAVALLGALGTGCVNMEKKLGRGLSNTAEVVRAGEYRRTVEQTAIFDGAEAAYTTGQVRGINRSIARTGIGLYEIITFPFPPYRPVLTKYFTPSPAFPDSNTPDLVEDSLFATDNYVGYNGGDTAPFIPGSRFHIFSR